MGNFDFEYDDIEGSCYYAVGGWKDLSSDDIVEIHSFLDIILPLLFKLSNYKNRRTLVTSGFIKKVRLLNIKEKESGFVKKISESLLYR
jgi:hypothetical protein